MKLIKILLILVLLLTLFVVPSFALDTDLYMSQGTGVPPNVLIIFDNSISMGNNVPAPPYDPSHIYDGLEVLTTDRNKVYSCPDSCTKYRDDVSQVLCATAYDNLNTVGYYQGYLKSKNDSSCGTRGSGTYYTLRTGNYRNYLKYVNNDPEYSRSKIDVAKDRIKEFINQADGIRVGIMVFNYEEGGHILVGPPDPYTGYRCDIATLERGGTQAQQDADQAIRNSMKGALDSLTPETYTPLAETLYEAGLYYKGKPSYFNFAYEKVSGRWVVKRDAQGNPVPLQYTTPVQYSCQKNYVIIITDGDSTKDKNNILATAVGDQDKDGHDPGGPHPYTYLDYTNNPNGTNMDGSDWLDDVAKYLYDAKDSSVSISTYSIGFTVRSQHDLLSRAAQLGNGKYYYCENAQGLAESFQSAIGNILAVSTSYLAPIVPVSQFEKTTAGDKIYLALFKPIQNGIWAGNIKKFGVAQPKGVTSDCPNDGSIPVGEVIDANCKKALDPNGRFYSAAKSYWIPIHNDLDGGETQNGGVGEILMDRDFNLYPRQIYTYMGSNVSLTDSSNKFNLSNSLITPGSLGLLTEDEKKSVINFIHGYDYSPTPGEKRDWILGAIIHSRPVLVRYSDRSVIFAGSNDGMFHAFDDNDGKELWAFIPPTFLNQLSTLRLGGIQWFVDGSPKVYLGADKKIIVFGLRRGGNCYIALDITNPTSPEFLWMISPDKIVYKTTTTYTSDYTELKQSWSTPQIGKIDDGTADGKWVAFIGGGYDNDNQDKENPYTNSPDSKGRAIYVVDVKTGARIWHWSNAEDSTMTYSIPSDIAKVDTNGDGKIDRLYVGDMGGRIWRFDIAGSDKSKWTEKIIFKSNPDGATTNLRKIFYPPDVTLEYGYELIFFGTGDREHPSDKTIINRLYSVKDKNPETAYTEDDLLDVTTDKLQTGTDAEKTSTLTDLNTKSGWFIQLLPSDSGEKSLSPPVVYYKTAYFTTFAPSPDVPDPGKDPCYVGEGTARLYALGYNTGNAVLNLDLTNDVGGIKILKRDRSEVIGGSIPSGVIITFIQGTGVAYTGVGGGIDKPPLPNTKSLVPITWRIVF
jgi:type IV pilus assembly protein PilY1